MKIRGLSDMHSFASRAVVSDSDDNNMAVISLNDLIRNYPDEDVFKVMEMKKKIYLRVIVSCEIAESVAKFAEEQSV